MEISVSGKLSCCSGHSEIVLHKVIHFGKSQIFDFLTVLNVMNILENFPAIFEILVSIQRNGSEKLICLCDYAQIFLIQKVMALGNLEFLTIFLKVFFSKTTLPNLTF